MACLMDMAALRVVDQIDVGRGKAAVLDSDVDSER